MAITSGGISKIAGQSRRRLVVTGDDLGTDSIQGNHHFTRTAATTDGILTIS